MSSNIEGKFRCADDDAGEVSNEFRPEAECVPLLLLVCCLSEAVVLELGVGRSEAGPASGETDMLFMLSLLIMSCNKLDPKNLPSLPGWRIRSRIDPEPSLGQRPSIPLKAGIGFWGTFVKLGSISTISGLFPLLSLLCLVVKS